MVVGGGSKGLKHPVLDQFVEETNQCTQSCQFILCSLDQLHLVIIGYSVIVLISN